MASFKDLTYTISASSQFAQSRLEELAEKLKSTGWSLGRDRLRVIGGDTGTCSVKYDYNSYQEEISMERILIIDDLRILKPSVGNFGVVEYARTSEEGIAALKRGGWNTICLDHDLGGDDTIRPVIDYLTENAGDFDVDLTRFIAISSNPVGVSMMKSALDRAGLTVLELPETDKRDLFDYLDWVEMTGT